MFKTWIITITSQEKLKKKKILWRKIDVLCREASWCYDPVDQLSDQSHSSPDVHLPLQRSSLCQPGPQPTALPWWRRFPSEILSWCYSWKNKSTGDVWIMKMMKMLIEFITVYYSLLQKLILWYRGWCICTHIYIYICWSVTGNMVNSYFWKLGSRSSTRYGLNLEVLHPPPPHLFFLLLFNPIVHLTFLFLRGLISQPLHFTSSN